MTIDNFTQNTIFKTSGNAEERAFWQTILTDQLNMGGFPLDFQRLKQEQYNQAVVQLAFPHDIANKIQTMSNQSSLALYMILLTGSFYLLQRYTDCESVTVGIPAFSEGKGGSTDLLALSIDWQRDWTWKAFLMELRQKVKDVAANQNFPVQKVLEQIASATGNDLEPVFKTVVYLENLHGSEFFYPADTYLGYSSTDSGIQIKISYNRALYEEKTVKQWGEHLINFFTYITQAPDTLLTNVEVLSTVELERILLEFNATTTDYPKSKTLHQIFQEQVERWPNAIALSYHGEEMTYQELNERANEVAGLLRKKGIKPAEVVAIMVDRSPKMIIGMLGILKAGGAYLPIDPTYPQNRILSILNDSEAAILLSTEEVIDGVPYTLLQSMGDLAENVPVLSCPRAQIKDFDKLPIPDRTYVDYSKYTKYIGLAMVNNLVAIQGTRGCPYNCAYCHKIWPKKHVVRSAENIFKEVKQCYDSGMRRFAFLDDIFNLDVENSTRFFKLVLEHGLKIQIFFPNGVRGDILTKDYIDLMIAAGTVTISMSLETGSPRLQKLIGKNLRLERLKENLQYIAENHPHVVLELNSMLGFPTETEEEARMTLDFIKSIKWLHFPYVHVLKIYPGTDMAKIALENGVTMESIQRSEHLAYHELPHTLPFSKSFAIGYQTEFLNEYFLNKERLLKVLPVQMQFLTENELILKYNSYLPTEINCFDDLLACIGIRREELTVQEFSDQSHWTAPEFNEKIKQYFPVKECKEDSLKVLLLDLSQFFSNATDKAFSIITEPPLGLMYLLTYLHEKFGNQVYGKIAKSRIDFDSPEDLKAMIDEFKPDIIGIRTLNYYKNFFHKTVATLRQMGVDVPIIGGGPYASSSYTTMLRDPNIDLAVIGEGEHTLAELVEQMLANGKLLPSREILQSMPGIALATLDEKGRTGNRDIILFDYPIGGQGIGRENLDEWVESDSLAYVMYTSGSTGKPKGNLTTHYNISRVVKETNYIEITPKDTLLQLSNYAFDGSTFDIYGALLNGAKLVLIDSEEILDISRLSNRIAKEGITIFFVTTALLNTLIDVNIDCFANVRKVLFGGERVSVRHVKRLVETFGAGRVVHVYGPTESTVFATYHPINAVDERWNTIPIGRPLANTSVYILSNDQQVQPLGVAGELCIDGDGLVKGYLHQPELTRDKFIPNPFVAGQVMYKTGDLARWNINGEIEFLGRIDDQVKLRGFRIELGEIESQLLTHPLIKEALVEMKETPNSNKYLCAYYLAEREIPIAEIKEYLSRELPEYMVPTQFIQLGQFPLTPNGKIDRRALSQYDKTLETGAEYVEPEGEVETHLAEIWKQILEVASVSAHDNFFDLGGHSLKSTVLVARIHKDFQVNVPLKAVFEEPTLRDLAQYIQRMEQERFTAIPASPVKDRYLASPAQKRIYALSQFEGVGLTYNMPRVLQLAGTLDENRLQAAFIELVKRHESLRTSFELVDGTLYQLVAGECNFSIEEVQLEESAVSFFIKSFIQPFDLAKAPLLRVGLIKAGIGKHYLLFDMHHIISDGTSIGILIRELLELYQGHLLPELRIQYKDYSEWQFEESQQKAAEKAKVYWLKQFAGELPQLNLPTDWTRPAIQSFEGDSISFDLDELLSKKLQQLAKQSGGTMFMVLLAAYNLLLSRYSGQEDIIVGTPIAGRPHADLQNVIGMFVNTLALRNQPTSELTFLEFIQKVKESSLSALDNQNYQFEELVEALKLDRDLSRNPLFDTMFTMQNVDLPEILINGLQLTPYDFEYKVSKFDLTLNTIETKSGVQCTFEYSTKLFSRETIERMAGHFVQLLQGITAKPEGRLAEFSIITPLEEQVIREALEQPEVELTTPIYQRFEQQVAKTPSAIAVRFEGQVLTYQQLNSRANQLARVLRAKGVKADSIVALLMERSFEMIIGIIATQKAGGAYLPIDPTYPRERIEFMLEDSKTNLCLTEETILSNLNFAGEVVNLNDTGLYVGDDSNLEVEVKPNDLAYVIYTSGSTGQPKGTLIEHHSLINRLCWMQKAYPIGSEDVILQKTPFTFDVSVWELFWWSFTGASLIFLKPGGEREPEAIVQAIEEERVTVMHFVPSMLNAFLEYVEKAEVVGRLKSLKRVFASGEALQPEQVRRFNLLLHAVNGTCLTNLYGPTEATIDVTYFDAVDNERLEIIPIGKPIENIQITIIGKYGEVLPVGVPGELCISGVGLARGYLNRPEITAEKFVQHPVFPNRLMYRSGDLAKWRNDGNLEYLGRIDHQVKVRGFRIELGEIEKCLLSNPVVKEAVVTALKDNDGNAYLAAYLVVVGEFNEAELRNHLAQTLPEYMIPAYFVQLETLPLTANGKIDRKALPEPAKTVRKVEYVAPETEVQAILAELWSEVLGVQQIGIHDHFFNLGGDSIKAIQILSRLNKYNLKLEINDLFRNPTISEVSKYVKASNRIAEQGLVTGQINLTPVQRWFFDQQFTDEHHWNQAVMLYRRDGFEPTVVERVITRIVEHHDALRMVFKRRDGEIAQLDRALDGNLFTLEVVDLADHPDSKSAIESLASDLQGSIELDEGPLMRLGLYHTSEGDHLLIAVHHLVMDGISWRILFEDFAFGYLQALQGEEIRFPAKSDSYLEWSKALEKYATSKELLKELAYWGHLEDLKIAPLPKDQQIEVSKVRNSKNQSVTFSKAETDRLLKEVHHAYNTEINDLLLTALSRAVYDWAQAENLLINLEGHGREAILADLDISRTIGWFTSIYPVVLSLPQEKDLGYQIKQVKETLAHIPNNGIGYGIAKYLTPKESRGGVRFDLQPEISFNYLGQFDQDVKSEVYTISPFASGLPVSPNSERKYLLDINGMIVEGRLILTINYDQTQYSEATISRLIDAYQTNLLAIIEHCVKKDVTELTPSDFTSKDLELDEVEEIFDLFEGNQ